MGLGPAAQPEPSARHRSKIPNGNRFMNALYHTDNNLKIISTSSAESSNCQQKY